MGQYRKKHQGMIKVGVCRFKQVSLELASKTMFCLLGSDSLWEPVPLNWCSNWKATPTDVLLGVG